MISRQSARVWKSWSENVPARRATRIRCAGMPPFPMLPMVDPGRPTDQDYCLSRVEVCWADDQPKWCIRQVGCDFSASGAFHGVLVRAGEVAVTLRVRGLSEEETHKLARMTRSQKLDAGL